MLFLVTALFWFLVMGTGTYCYGLFSPALPHDWVYAIYAVVGLVLPYGLWASTYVVAIDAERIVVSRAFRLINRWSFRYRRSQN